MAWYSPIIRDFIEEIRLVGIHLTEEQVQFTGFWSQGDGASFEFDVSDCDAHNFLQFLLKSGLKLEGVIEMEELSTPEQDLFHELTGSMSTRQWIQKHWVDLLISSERTSSRYSHEMTCRIEVDQDGSEISESQLDAIQEFAEAWRIRQCTRLYRKLEKWYEEHESESLDYED